MSKVNYALIGWRSLLPLQSGSESIQEIVEKDMNMKKATLLKKIADKVGEVTEMDLHSGNDGSPNGIVRGTKGAVKITTIMAGGDYIQCLHYRVLVKVVK